MPLISLLLTLLLGLLHWFVPILRRWERVSECFAVSFGGGFAVAFVFLHLLPGLVESGQSLAEILQDSFEQHPLLDLGIFLSALLGFTLYYGLELIARHQRQRRHHQRDGIIQDHEFLLHFIPYAIYNGLLTYTLPLQIESGMGYAVLFVVAMGFHYSIIDRKLEHAFGSRFERQGRLGLLLTLLMGWSLAVLTEPENLALVALLVGLLSGTTLLNVFLEELSLERESSFLGFVTGVALGSGLVTMLVWLG